MASVHRWWAAPMTLRDAIMGLARVLPIDGATAFLATPGRFIVARAEVSGALATGDGRPVVLGDVFEARLFCPAAELRWLGTREGGRAVIVAEESLALAAEAWRPLEPLQAELLSGHYLVWGEGLEAPADLAAGWSRLAMARIGALDVPLAGVGPGARVQIESVEYLVEHEHGNVAVAEERFLRLVALAGEAPKGVTS